MAGSADPDSGRSAVSSRTGSPRMGSRDREESVNSDRERKDVRLLLAASVPQRRIAKLTGSRCARSVASPASRPTLLSQTRAPSRGGRGPGVRRWSGPTGRSSRTCWRPNRGCASAATPEASRRCTQQEGWQGSASERARVSVNPSRPSWWRGFDVAGPRNCDSQARACDTFNLSATAGGNLDRRLSIQPKI